MKQAKIVAQQVCMKEETSFSTNVFKVALENAAFVEVPSCYTF